MNCVKKLQKKSAFYINRVYCLYSVSLDINPYYILFRIHTYVITSEGRADRTGDGNTEIQ